MAAPLQRPTYDKDVKMLVSNQAKLSMDLVQSLPKKIWTLDGLLATEDFSMFKLDSLMNNEEVIITASGGA